MQQHGTKSTPRVADIVAAAGLSNDAFYRHFASKDALVAAILEDGTQRLTSYLRHQMDKEQAPEGRIVRWVEGVLSQADGEVATATLAVLFNGGTSADGAAAGRHFASAPLAELLHPEFEALGSTAPELHSTLAAHAVLGVLADLLWARSQPTKSERATIVDFCIRIPTIR
jgi:AcrR family transcriptional regulator